MVPRLMITAGEPAGIGPDLLALLSRQNWPAELVVCADPDLLQQRARALGYTLEVHTVDYATPARPQQAGTLTVDPVSLHQPVVPGQLDAANAAYVVETLGRAADRCLTGMAQAIVTGPVHKGIINEAGRAFSGHTEFFADRAGVDQVVMMLATQGLRVALATTHLPLRDVAGAITAERLTRVLRILHHDLQTKYRLAQPRILVCGLNPHAGEGGHLGHEEIDVIEPVLRLLNAEGMDLMGPMPADTLFQPKYLDNADAVLAMYHDQGLPVLKYKGFGAAVNITLGLPFVRTSVDHGTALDLAGTSRIETGSFTVAINEAIQLSGSVS